MYVSTYQPNSVFEKVFDCLWAFQLLDLKWYHWKDWSYDWRWLINCLIDWLDAFDEMFFCISLFMTKQLMFGSQSSINLTLLAGSVTHGDFFWRGFLPFNLQTFNAVTRTWLNAPISCRFCLRVNACSYCFGFLLFIQSILVVFKIINCNQNAYFSSFSIDVFAG